VLSKDYRVSSWTAASTCRRRCAECGSTDDPSPEVSCPPPPCLCPCSAARLPAVEWTMVSAGEAPADLATKTADPALGPRQRLLQERRRQQHRHAYTGIGDCKSSRPPLDRTFTREACLRPSCSASIIHPRTGAEVNLPDRQTGYGPAGAFSHERTWKMIRSRLTGHFGRQCLSTD
jgi:hypothetical protein